jgi:hypothetical protein
MVLLFSVCCGERIVMFRATGRAQWLFLLLTMLLGCGKNVGSVSGKVTLDGVPLTKGMVTLHRKDDPGFLAFGEIGPQGAFAIQNRSGSADLTPGEYVATVVASEFVPSTTDGEEGILRELAPAKYASSDTSPLVLQVKAEAHYFPLVLLSRE